MRRLVVIASGLGVLDVQGLLLLAEIQGCSYERRELGVLLGRADTQCSFALLLRVELLEAVHPGAVRVVMEFCRVETIGALGVLHGFAARPARDLHIAITVAADEIVTEGLAVNVDFVFAISISRDEAEETGSKVRIVVRIFNSHRRSFSLEEG
jgi:hypothetical protein